MMSDEHQLMLLRLSDLEEKVCMIYNLIHSYDNFKPG